MTHQPTPLATAYFQRIAQKKQSVTQATGQGLVSTVSSIPDPPPRIPVNNPQTAMTAFNLDDTGISPVYVAPNPNDSTRSRDQATGQGLVSTVSSILDPPPRIPVNNPQTAMTAFNLDDTGISPVYVAPNPNVSTRSRDGSLRIPSRGMGIQVCEPDYLEHLVELRRAALAAKRMQPKEESWDD